MSLAWIVFAEIYVGLVDVKIVPFTVGGFAGATVYPRSPFRTVPEPVLVYVLARRAKLSTPVRSKGPDVVPTRSDRNTTGIRPTTTGSTRIFLIADKVSDLRPRDWLLFFKLSSQLHAALGQI
jgi:hypothetical protein